MIGVCRVKPLWIVGGLSALLIAALSLHIQQEQKGWRVNGLRLKAILLADQLRHSSDDLTGMARGYVATGDPLFKKQYQHILDMREGRSPRPKEDYHVYHDLILANVEPHTPFQSAKPLLELMREYDYTPAEIDLLVASKQQSDALTQTEFEAMRLAEGTHPGDNAARLQALRLLHSTAYFAAKAAIMQPIEQVYSQLNRRLQARMAEAWRMAAWFELFAVVVGALLAGVLYAEQRRIIKFARKKKLVEQHFRALTDYGPALIWTTDCDNRCTFVNNAWLNFTGRRLAQELGNGWQNGVHPDDLERCRQIYSTAFDQQQPFDMEMRVRAADGEYHWIRSNGIPRFDAENVFIGYIGHCMDISEIKHAEQQLRKLSLAVEQSGSIIVITDTDARIEYVNQAFVNSTGYTREEVIGKNPRILQSGKTPDTTYAVLWQALMQGQVWQGELFNRRKNGEEFIEYAVISPLREADGSISYYVAAKNDITELRQATEALQAYQNKLEQMIEERTLALERQNTFLEDLIATMPCGVFRLKQMQPSPVDEHDGNNRLVFGLEVFGHRVHQLLGLDQNQAITSSKELIGHIHPDDREPFLERIETAKTSMIAVSWEGCMLIKDSPHWMHINLIPRRIDGELMLTGILLDINDRMQQRDWLYRSAIESSPDAFVAIDQQDRILEWSPQAERLFGFKASEVVGQCFSSTIIPPMYVGDHDYHVRHFCGNDSSIIGKRIRVTAKNRNHVEFPVELQITAQQVDNQWRFTSFIRDIREVVIAEQKMAQLEKLEAIGHLTGGLAHDFNNILGIIIGNLDLMRYDVPGGEPLEMLDTAMSAARRGAEITKSLLAVARRDNLISTAVDINKALLELSPILRQLAGKRVQLKISAFAVHAQVMVDVGGFNNAMINLVINAQDAMPDGGEILIYSYSLLFEETQAQELGIQPGYYLVIGVDDTGIGMSNETLSKAFDPFFTTKGLSNGTGLGLAMIWGFCQQSGGSAHIESRPGKGCSVQMILPLLTTGSATPATEQQEESCATLEKTGRVLVVDDEVELAKIIARWLEDAGCEVLTVETAQAAIELLAQQRFDLLLTDITMPGNMDGLGLARTVAVDYPDQPILLMSGAAANMSQQDRSQWPLLQKPISKQLLFKAANIALHSAPLDKH